MAFIPADNTARVAMHFSRDSQQVENVFYVKNDAGWTDTSLFDLCDTVVTWWNTSMKANVASNLTLNEVTAKDLTSSAGIEVVYTTGLPISGTNVGVALPNNVTIAIKLLTGFGGRSYRGRQYINGLLQGHLGADQNTLSTSSITMFAGAYNDLISQLNTAYTPGMVVASFYSGVDSAGKPIPRATALTTPILNAGFADNILDSQRRRLPGRGR